MAQATHSVLLTAPHYAPGGGAALHRFLAPDFVPRFRDALAAGTLTDPRQADWQQGDRFSRHDEALVLRLPVHRTFYLVACEAVCETPGRPALDPQRITSAGFVIRRIGGAAERTWRLDGGTATGWQLPADAAEPRADGTDARGRDPDVKRRLRQRRERLLKLQHPAREVRARTAPAGPYSGEETHPLQPLLVTGADGRPRTVLFGFLPLGGQFLPPAADLDTEALIAADRAGLPYPLDRGGNIGRHWRDAHGALVADGRASALFAAVLRLLVQRYHLGAVGTDQTTDDNADLAAWAGTQTFSDGLSLLDYLAAQAAADPSPLVTWLADRERLGDAHTDPLPAPPAAGGALDSDLYVSAADAEELHAALGERVVTAAERTAGEVPVPKYQQGADDLFQVLPFLRTRDADGCECVVWGEQARSLPFRVAAPFDPDASRPAVLQMPSLDDLRRGMAKGASMLIPADTQQLLDSLKLNKGATEEVVGEPSGASLGIQWICSFSLPVITLVAMILLMIMIALLNIVFFWLPWVRICLPFPKRS